ncbi:L-threonylcarbamoyladenylate synthase [Kribbella sp. NPDC050281]|uniref:L-threonylcarbamoyladenylate synthase n=1 Tax=Kribbella sp. NPDC050281 TaxID=3155515 RepID=UPI0034029421
MRCVSERFDFTGDELAPAYRAAVDAIEAGDLVVLPTDTVYGIAADAFKADAVQRLLDAKGRGRDMPPPVLISVVESLDALATDVPDDGRTLCQEFWPGPLTVICHAQTSLMWDLGETKGTVALRVPDHENTRELLSRTGPLAVSSANKSGRPAALDVYDAEEQLEDTVAVYLDGGTATGGQPSTIVDITGDTPHVVRLGALSLEQLRAVVPGVTSYLDDDKPDEEPEDKQDEEPEAKADEPEAKADEPEAKADEPEAKADEPEAKADEPEAKADEPEATPDETDEKPTEEPVAASNEQDDDKPPSPAKDDEKPSEPDDVRPAD